MAYNNYSGSGASLELALKKLYKTVQSDEGDTDCLGQASYQIHILDKKNDNQILGQSIGNLYDQVFLAALKDAGMSPAGYNPRQHKLEVNVRASLQAKEEAKPVRASGCDGPKRYSTTLTDKF